MFYVFTRDPIHQLDAFAATVKERDSIIAGHKQAYPNVPVYWISVNVG